jgi:hypothetical protein
MAHGFCNLIWLCWILPYFLTNVKSQSGNNGFGGGDDENSFRRPGRFGDGDDSFLNREGFRGGEFSGGRGFGPNRFDQASSSYLYAPTP